MTRETYGQSYQEGFDSTVRFLISRGLCCDAAQETAQAAWAKGWECLAQLRNESMVVTWVNTIALNAYRSIRRKPLHQALPELPTAPQFNLAAIDVDRILRFCKSKDRLVLTQHYLDGSRIKDIAQKQGWTQTAVRIRLLRARRSARIGLCGGCLRAPSKSPLPNIQPRETGLGDEGHSG